MPDRYFDATTGCYCRELAGRPGLDGPSDDRIERQFLVYKTSDPLVGRNCLINLATSINLYEFANLPLQTITWKLKSRHDHWVYTCNYNQDPAPEGYTISIDTTGGSSKQTEAFSQVKFDATGETSAREYGTTVNVQNDNPVGVDRVIPSLKINVNARISSSFITSPIDYAKIIAGLTGSVNSNAYLGFDPGELLFMGATGDIVGTDPALTFTFAASANLTGLTVGPVQGINKNGHDYIWFDYKELKDANSGLKISKPRAAYVAKVYEYKDFTPLRIGASPA